MKKNIFFEKVGKLTFSVILTGFTVTALVYAASSFTNGQVLDAGDLNNAFDEKLSISNIPACGENEYLTSVSGGLACKELGLDTTLSQSDVLDTITSSCKICLAWSDRDNAIREGYGSNNDYACVSFDSSLYGIIDTNGDVNGDDKFGVKVVCDGGTWSTETSGYSAGCSWAKNTTPKEGMCFAGETYTYYSGATPCQFSYGYYGDGRGELDLVDGYRYDTKHVQTCE